MATSSSVMLPNPLGLLVALVQARSAFPLTSTALRFESAGLRRKQSQEVLAENAVDLDLSEATV